MVRSTAISWTIGLAVAAAALSLWQLPAKADDGGVEKVETRPQPIEPKTVRVILLPPASDAAFALRPPGSAKAARIIPVQPADDAAVAPPGPGKIQEDAAFVERSSLSESPPRAVLQPSASNAATALPRPEPAKLRKDASLVEIPSLPERPPFRPALYDVEPVDNEQDAAATFRKQPGEPASFMAKINSVFQPLANLWQGSGRASEAISPTVEGKDRGVAISASADADQAGDKAEVERKPASFLKALRFWER